VLVNLSHTQPSALAVYGTLQPGGPNEHILSPYEGEWIDGYVLGNLEHQGWGADVGFPGIRLCADGGKVPVKLFVSNRLPELWQTLDEFEGEGYLRTLCKVETANGSVEAQIYQLAD